MLLPPGLGVQDFYGFEELEVLGVDSLAVNLANGNLVVRSEDLGLNGPGIGLSVERFYNSLAQRQGALGAGWSLSAGQDVGLQIEETEVIFRAPSGFQATFELDGDEWVGPSGLNAQLEETEEGRWELRYNRTDESQVFSAGGYLLASVERNGNTLEYHYDNDDRLVSVTDAAGRVTILDYEGELLTGITDPAGRQIHYTYDDDGRLTEYQIPTGSGSPRALFDYDDDGQLISISAGSGAEGWETSIELAYDEAGRVSDVIQHNGDQEPSEWALAYGTGETVVTDPAGEQSSYEIDDQGRVASATDALGRTQSQEWTANSDIATSEDAMGEGSEEGNVTEFDYDALNNPTSVAMPTGAGAMATYTIGEDCDSTTEGHPYKVKCATDTEGNPSSFDYDEAGNLTANRSGDDSGARELTYTYHGADGEDCGAFSGQICTSTNGEGNTTTFSYDTDGNVTQIAPPGPAAPTVFTYNSVGMVISATTGAVTIDYRYDAAGRMTALESGGGVDRVINRSFYDPASRLTSERHAQRVDDSGVINFDRSHEYAGALGLTGTEHTFFDSRTQGRTQVATQVEHDRRGNITGIWTAEDGAADPASEVAYTYDAANQLTSIVEPGGSCADPTAADSGCIQLEYDNNGAEVQRTLPGGAQVQTERDASGRESRITTLDAGGEEVADYSYSFDAGGEDSALIQTRTDHVGLQAPAGAVTSYSYDSLNRLIEAVEEDSGGAVQAEWEYAYDRNGNRTLADETEYSYDAADRINQIDGEDAGLDYNDRGDLLNTPDGTQLAYGDNGTLQSAISADGETEVETLYAGETNADPFQTTAGDETVRYLSSPLGHLNEFDTQAGQEVDVTRTPDGSPVALRDQDSTRYLAADHLGSTTAELDPTGAAVSTHAYDPYGQDRDQAPSTFGYAGGVINPAADLTRFGARHYTPALGTFTQIDPSGTEDAPYQYAAGDPVNNADPTGLISAAMVCTAVLGLSGIVLEAGATGIAYALGVAFWTGLGVTVAIGIAWLAISMYMCFSIDE